MKVSVIDIQVPPEAGDRDPSARAPFDVRVLVEIGSEREWFSVTVRPGIVPGFESSLVAASPELLDRFQDDQPTMREICRLAGQAARLGAVHLPQRIAA